MKGCIILYGACFRLGSQLNTNIGLDNSYDQQIAASYSHMKLINHLKSKNINTDIYISSYSSKFNENLCNIYKDHLIINDFYNNLIGQHGLIYNIFNKINNTSQYKFILLMRIDIFLKDMFIEIFNENWDNILWPSICMKPHHQCGIYPRVNDLMMFIPNKYFNYIKYIIESKHNPHNSWEYLIKNTNLTNNDLDTMIHTYHDSDSEKDFNPLYYIVNRPETKIHRTPNDIFNKFNN